MSVINIVILYVLTSENVWQMFQEMRI